MTNEPVLVFLHGVGTGDPEGTWKTHLSESLESVGYDGLDGLQAIAPRYAHALRDTDDDLPLPALTVKAPTGDAARRNRREFERRIGAMEFRLGRQEPGGGIAGGEIIADFALGVPVFEQARNYLKKPAIRAQVLTRVLQQLPQEGRIVIVGHSLGSVVAADLLRRLPAGVDVVGMVTIGSPLAAEVFGVDQLRKVLDEPPTNLGWWVSFWNGVDPVAARRGVSSAFPWMIDFRVPAGTVDLIAAHKAVTYLDNDAIAEAVGFALFGSKSKEIVPSERGVDVPVNAAEKVSLLALRYAHLVGLRLEGDQRDRYIGALRHVQADVVGALRRERERAKQPFPSVIARLAFDLSDSKAVVPLPQPLTHLTKEEAVVSLTVLASENIIRPFEISVADTKKQKAMEDLTVEMGLGSAFGKDVFASVKEAHDVLAGSRINWIKWGAVGAGAALLVVATGGLALAAGGGLVGAAALTSALAAFGPGGMIGGLLTAGTLVTAGGGGIAFGLASTETSAETFEAVVLRQLTAVELRRRQRLDQDPAVWRNLVETEMEVRRTHERLDEFSDESAQAMKALKRKLEAVERALTYLRKLGLEPGADVEKAHTADGDERALWFRPTTSKSR